eukprot:4675197-Amphidinium_carterae.1
MLRTTRTMLTRTATRQQALSMKTLNSLGFQVMGSRQHHASSSSTASAVFNLARRSKAVSRVSNAIV